MLKKFLALMATLSLLSSSVAFAIDITPGNPGVAVEDYVTSFTVNTDEFDPSNGETTTVVYTLAADATTYVYVLNDSFDVVATLAPKAMQTAGTHAMTWNGTVANLANGTTLSDGAYSVRIFAYDANDNVIDYDYNLVGINSLPPSITGPYITDLSVSPSDIEVVTGSTTITFTLSETSTLDVEVRDGSTVVEQFSNYDGTVSYNAGTYALVWDGSNNTGDYTVSVTALNNDGSDVKTADVTVSRSSTPNSDGVIENVQLNPRYTWDPLEDDELEIEFDLTADVDDLLVYARMGNKEVEILDDNYADEDDYTELWDGTDEDGDEVDQGTWEIVIEADNDIVVQTIEIVYETPEITEAFVTKTSFDNTIDEVTNLVFKVDTDAVVTVEIYDGSKRIEKLIDEETVDAKRWYTVEWDGTDDGDEEDEGDYEFRITAEHEFDNDVYDTAQVDVRIKEDEVSSSKSNATNDYIEPIVFDDKQSDSVTFTYCIDEDADVFLAVYDGFSTSGSAEVELMDYVAQSEGCHDIKWDVKDGSKSLRDDVYSYKLIARSDSGSKDTETGRFVVGNVAGVDNNNNGGGGNGPSGQDCAKLYWDVATVSPTMCQAITWATDEGIFNGNPDGSFAPYRAINRAETLAVTLRTYADNLTMFPANGSNLGFVDVNTSAWYMTFIRTGKFYGMIHGYVNHTEARPEQSIIRSEFLKFALEGADAFTSYEIPGFESSSYADVVRAYPENVWYFDYAGVANQYGLYDTVFDVTTGLQYLEPNKLVQRGEVALVLYRMHLAGLLD